MSHGKRLTLSLLIFGVSFGYLEAAVVAYLNALYAPAYKRFYPNAKPGDSFPLLTEKQIQEGGIDRRLLLAEVAREVATLGMLAAVAAAVARTSGEWLAAFAISFGLVRAVEERQS